MKKLLAEALQLTFVWFMCSSSIGMVFILGRFAIYNLKMVDVHPSNILQFFLGGILPAIYIYVSGLNNEKKKEVEFQEKLDSVHKSYFKATEESRNLL